MTFDNLNEVCVEGDDITQFIDQNIIECFCFYMVVKVDDPVSELAGKGGTEAIKNQGLQIC